MGTRLLFRPKQLDTFQQESSSQQKLGEKMLFRYQLYILASDLFRKSSMNMYLRLEIRFVLGEIFKTSKNLQTRV